MAHGRKEGGFDLQIKLLTIGNSGVGKTCLLLRYANDAFSPTFITTIGESLAARDSGRPQRESRRRGGPPQAAAAAGPPPVAASLSRRRWAAAAPCAACRRAPRRPVAVPRRAAPRGNDRDTFLHVSPTGRVRRLGAGAAGWGRPNQVILRLSHLAGPAGGVCARARAARAASAAAPRSAAPLRGRLCGGLRRQRPRLLRA